MKLMSIETRTHTCRKRSRRRVVRLAIRVRTTAPDDWLDRSGKSLSRRLVTTGSQCRSTVHDVLGRQSTRGLNRAWASSERWKDLDDAKTKKPRTRLQDLDDLLEPLIGRGRLQVEVKSKGGKWITLSEAAADPTLVV